MKTFSNPILPGFYPDPSICRVGEEYYMVNSTFMYFPGVPIFHSKDLVHWNQIGNVLDRASQIPLENGGHSCGIYAPTIRYHEGVFYMITTNVANGGNFIVTATDPSGPWSEPYYLDAEGIDPSLFFDEDGRCYYCGTKDRRDDCRFFGDNEIYVQELDYKNMVLLGESKPIWHGALKDVAWPEGPHLYKKDGWYYLMISEAGTGHAHAVTMARSKDILDYFEGYNCNPILTHRHLGKDYPIVNVGHPDMVETQNGEWWMVCLASRPYSGYYRNLGRETFLVSMKWEDGWPLINPGKGIVTSESQIPNLPYYEQVTVPECDDFNESELPYHLLHIRNPIKENYILEPQNSVIKLKGSSVQLSDEKSPTCLCRRQTSMSYKFMAKIYFHPQENEKGGICLIQSNEYHYALSLIQRDSKYYVELVKCEAGKSTLVEEVEISHQKESLTLKVHAHEQSLKFSYKYESQNDFEVLCDGVDARILSTDIAGGFVGTCVGVYTISEYDDPSVMEVDWMKYVSLN